jgi:hypothetical protein
MRALVLIVAALIVAGCGEDDAASTSSDATNLVITIDQDGEKGTPPSELKLDCAKPENSEACAATDKLTKTDLAPTPEGQACTQIYGGPETATIKGTLHGENVDASFSRTDGCEIERWQTVEPLLQHVK